MSTNDNNLPHKESLMHEINALFAPPTNETYGRKGSLGLVSERLVCDRCPASFHLECLDPPLDPDEAPVGVWYCHRCSMLIKVCAVNIIIK
ncbi:unnamed protein product [Trichobilharzia regenti]|nr:unnamed protein product [Trichobilharzia regenti]